MLKRLERLRQTLARCRPFELEIGVRMLLIHYFFHVSDRANVELVGTGSRTLNLLTPTVFKGQGRIRIDASATFGVQRSPGSYSCSYVEARTPESVIEIGAGSVFNNRLTLISEGAGIRFGERCLVGPEVFVVDANSHELQVEQRSQPDSRPMAVEIGDDVFIGARAIILKGSRIGKGSIVSAGAVVPPRFVAPDYSIIAGNPALVVGRVAGAAG